MAFLAKNEYASKDGAPERRARAVTHITYCCIKHIRN
jgi:hypothetical protein